MWGCWMGEARRPLMRNRVLDGPLGVQGHLTQPLGVLSLPRSFLSTSLCLHG